MMDGGDFREFARSIACDDTILFQTADGNFHEIYSAYRVWTKEAGPRVVLVEAETFAKKWPLTLEAPPQELVDYLNSIYSGKL